MSSVKELREQLVQLRNDLEFVRVELQWQQAAKTEAIERAKQLQMDTDNDLHKAYYVGLQDGIHRGLGAARSALGFIDECYPVRRDHTPLKLIRGGKPEEDENAALATRRTLSTVLLER